MDDKFKKEAGVKLILHTEVFGDGEPIVFLHTGLQTGTSDFIDQQEYFKAHYKVVVPDLRGHGYSIHDDFSNFFEDCSKDLAETLDHLGLDSVHLAGGSIGGLIGLVFAKRYPRSVRTLTISGVLPEKPANWTELHKQEVVQQSRLLENKEAVRYFDRLHASDWKRFFEMAKDENWYPFDQTKDLDGIVSPVLYMVGEGNKAEVQGAAFYSSLKEDVHVAILPFASHLVHTEQPSLYTAILETFLNEYRKID